MTSKIEMQKEIDQCLARREPQRKRHFEFNKIKEQGESSWVNGRNLARNIT